MLSGVELDRELEDVAVAAAAFAAADEEVAAIVPAEPSPNRRTYLCAFDGPDGRTWLALDSAGSPVTNRDRVRESISIAAACEVAEESSGDAGEVPRVASPAYLDRLGRQHGPGVAAALGEVVAVADELAREVEAQYKVPLT
jgi:hypothetical protein